MPFPPRNVLQLVKDVEVFYEDLGDTVGYVQQLINSQQANEIELVILHKLQKLVVDFKAIQKDLVGSYFVK